MADLGFWPKPSKWPIQPGTVRPRAALGVAHPAALHPARLGARQRGRGQRYRRLRYGRGGGGLAAEHLRLPPCRTRYGPASACRRRTAPSSRASEQRHVRLVGRERALHHRAPDQGSIGRRGAPSTCTGRALPAPATTSCGSRPAHAEPAPRGVAGGTVTITSAVAIVNDTTWQRSSDHVAPATPRAVPWTATGREQHGGEHRAPALRSASTAGAGASRPTRTSTATSP